MEIYSLENKYIFLTFALSNNLELQNTMKKIAAFAGSTSSTSINKQLVIFTSTLLNNTDSTIIDMNDHQAVIYSSDEEQKGFPDNLVAFSKQLKEYDGFIISLAEHNGSYAAAFKNTLDWLSRIDRVIFNNKPVLLMSASPGGRGGASVLASASTYFPHAGASEITSFSFPNFYDNFKDGKVVHQDLLDELKSRVEEFQGNL